MFTPPPPLLPTPSLTSLRRISLSQPPHTHCLLHPSPVNARWLVITAVAVATKSKTEGYLHSLSPSFSLKTATTITAYSFPRLKTRHGGFTLSLPLPRQPLLGFLVRKVKTEGLHHNRTPSLILNPAVTAIDYVVGFPLKPPSLLPTACIDLRPRLQT